MDGKHTGRVFLDLIEATDAVVEPLQSLVIVGVGLYLKQINRGGDVDSVRQRQHTVVGAESLTEQVEDGNNGCSRRDTLD